MVDEAFLDPEHVAKRYTSSLAFLLLPLIPLILYISVPRFAKGLAMLPLVAVAVVIASLILTIVGSARLRRKIARLKQARSNKAT